MTKISEPSCHLKKRQELPGNALCNNEGTALGELMAKSSDLSPCSKCSKSCCCTVQYAVTLFSPRPYFSLVSC